MDAVQIRIKGRLTAQVVGWFEGFAFAPTEQGDTLLTGPIRDQAAFFGLVNRCRDLGLTVISINPIPKQENQNEHYQG